MACNYDKLRGRVAEKYKTQTKFANALGLSQQSVSKMLGGKSDFTRKSIEKWAELLEIPKEEYADYFFI